MIGQLIGKYIVKGSGTGREAGMTFHYSTEKGARKKLSSIRATFATLYQETTCVNEYITIASK